MKKIILLLACCLLIQSVGKACMCMGDPFEERLNKKRAIFVGQLTAIFNMDKFEPLDGSGWFRKIYKFKVLEKCVAGGDFVTNWVYVLDNANSSCGGFLRNCMVGDTVLTFARMPNNPYEPGYIYGDQCCQYRILSADRKGREEYMFNIAPEEKAFLADSTMWQVCEHAPDVIPPTPPVKQPEPVHLPWFQILGVFSVLLNVLLLGRILMKEK